MVNHLNRNDATDPMSILRISVQLFLGDNKYVPFSHVVLASKDFCSLSSSISYASLFDLDR